MLNIQITQVQVHPSSKSVRVEACVAFGGHELARPYMYPWANESVDPGAEFINHCIRDAMTQVKAELYFHLASLARDAAYQSWAQKLAVANVIPAEKGAGTAATEFAQKKVEEAAKPVEAKKEEPKEEPKVEAPAPAAKEEPKTEAPKKRAKKAEKVDDVKVYQMGVDEFKAVLRAELDINLGANWPKDAEKKAKATEVAKKLAENKVPVLVNGEVPAEVKEAVASYIRGDEAQEDGLDDL